MSKESEANPLTTQLVGFRGHGDAREEILWSIGPHLNIESLISQEIELNQNSKKKKNLCVCVLGWGMENQGKAELHYHPKRKPLALIPQ